MKKVILLLLVANGSAHGQAIDNQIQITVAEGVIGTMLDTNPHRPAKEYIRSGKVFSETTIPVKKGEEAYKTFTNGGFTDPIYGILSMLYLTKNKSLEKSKALYVVTDKSVLNSYSDQALAHDAKVASKISSIQPIVQIDDADGHGTTVFYTVNFIDGTKFPAVASYKIIGSLFFLTHGSIGPNNPDLAHIYNALAKQIIKKTCDRYY